MLIELKQHLRQQKWIQPLRLANLKLRQRRGLFPDWRSILGPDWRRWELIRDKVQARDNGPRVLLASSVGIHAAASSFDSYLSVALTMRGARCEVALCDSVLPACLAADYTWYPNPGQFARRGSLDDLCTSCFVPARQLFGPEGLGLPVLPYSAFLSDVDRKRAHLIATQTPLSAIETFAIDGIAVGEAALSGALRFFARGDLESGPDEAAILRRYLEASCLALFAMRTRLAKEHYDVVTGHHGIYVPQALVAAAAHEAGIRFVAWNPAYRTGCFIFSHDETYHRAMLTEPTSAWEHSHLSDDELGFLMRYLSDREGGVQDWIAFHPPGAEASPALIPALGLDPDKPTVTLLTSVTWDAQLHYRQRAFKSQSEWVLATIRHFKKRSDLQLVIRIHPAEVTGSLPSRQTMYDEIKAAYPALPPNIAVIEPGHRVSTYALAMASDSVIIYSTKTGIELAARGMQTIVAGESWLRGKGIGHDCGDPEAYENVLASLPFGRRLDADRTRRAQLYAYHFFFRRMIPLPGFKRARLPGLPFEIAARGLTCFEPGSSPGLDLVCRGVLTGSPFVFDREGEGGPASLEHGH